MTHSVRARGAEKVCIILGRATLSMELSRVDMKTPAATSRSTRLCCCIQSDEKPGRRGKA